MMSCDFAKSKFLFENRKFEREKNTNKKNEQMKHI